MRTLFLILFLSLNTLMAESIKPQDATDNSVDEAGIYEKISSESDAVYQRLDKTISDFLEKNDISDEAENKLKEYLSQFKGNNNLIKQGLKKAI